MRMRAPSYSLGGVFRDRDARFFGSPSFFGLRGRLGFGSAEGGPSASTPGAGAGAGAGDESTTGLNAVAGVSSAMSAEYGRRSCDESGIGASSSSGSGSGGSFGR
jgi:hypothetical protein